jgi:glycosyltransferase involved in cell wall biosynthesis
MTPLVSILTPSLNQAAYVEDCLGSVRNQEYAPIEQIVVDGGSVDGTLDLVRRYESDRCRLLVRPETSQGEALNVALAESYGEIVGWLNTDDVYFGVDAVSTVVERFAAEPGCDVVYGDGVVADARGRILRHVSTSAGQLDAFPVACPLVQPAVFVRRSALAETFIREELEYALDYELWLRLSRRHRFCKVPRILALDRNRPGRKQDVGAEPYRAELAEVAREYGLGFGRRRPAEIGGAWIRRVSGLAEVLGLERRYRPAFDFQPDARWRRAVRQLLLPQRYVHLV